MDPFEAQLKVRGCCNQYENRYSKNVCCLLLAKIHGTSVREGVDVAIGRSRITVHRVLQGAIYLFHAQIEQLLQPDDHPLRVGFFNQTVAGMNFPSSVLLYDESTLSCKRVFSAHNLHMCV